MGNNLKKLRKHYNVTEKDLADYLHTSRKAYSHYEVEDRNIPVDLLVRLADYFGTSTDLILAHNLKKNGYVQLNKLKRKKKTKK